MEHGRGLGTTKYTNDTKLLLIFGSTCSRMRGGLKKADMLILIGVTFNNLQERKQHVYELTLPCIRGAWLQAQED